MTRKRTLGFESLEDRKVLNGANILPIEEFVEAQGTYCVDDGAGGCLQFVPPVDNFVGWLSNPDTTNPAAERALAVSVDYAGLASKYAFEQTGQGLGTDFSGKVTERELKDGRAELKVVLHTTNALTWVTDVASTGPSGNPFGVDNPTVFGNRIDAILENGASAAFASSTLTATIINPGVGMDVPDILQVLFEPLEGQELTRIHFQASGKGEFTEAGENTLGFEAGSQGQVTVSQVGILDGKFAGALADGFPVENVKLRQTGQVALASNPKSETPTSNEPLQPEFVDSVLTTKKIVGKGGNASVDFTDTEERGRLGNDVDSSEVDEVISELLPS